MFSWTGYAVMALLVTAAVVWGPHPGDVIVGPVSAAQVNPDPFVYPDGRRQGDTYRVRDAFGSPYTCAAMSAAGQGDPCVYDPDPEGNPVAVEPDNDPRPRWEITAPRITGKGGMFDPDADLHSSTITDYRAFGHLR